MLRSTILSLIFILALAFMVSCSGGGGNVVAPGPTGISEEGSKDVLTTEEPGNTVCLGLWQFVADKATGTVADLVQLRSADKILNVLGFMEPPPFSMMDLDWPSLDIDFANGTVDVGVILTHPINDDVFTGFDVRGVCFGPEVTNADGLTIIPGPEFFSGVPFGYQDGLLGGPDSHANYEGLAGYKYFCDDLGDDDDLTEFFTDPANLIYRGRFSPNQSIQRNYHLDWNNVEHNFMVFNYAIYANYDWPVGLPPWYVDDWEMSTANSAEAFCCSVTELAGNLHYYEGSGGGAISLQVEVWDWQGDIADVTIQSLEPGVITEASCDAASGNMGTDYSYGFGFNSVPGTPTATGDLDILITAVDGKTFGECWFLDLLPESNAKYGDNIYNCWIHTTTVSSSYIEVLTPNGGEEWKPLTNEDITWDSGAVSGTVCIDYSKDNFVSDIHPIATDEPNDGSYTWPVPCDPSNTVRVRVSSTTYPAINDTSDANFTILDIGWARTWGGTGDIGFDVAVDSSGNVYVTGYFQGSNVNFNPGGSDLHSSNGYRDVFLSKFDSSGAFQWARTWGGASWEEGFGVATDSSGNVYVSGYFWGTAVNFNPGGSDLHSSNGYNDVFLSKFDSSGAFQWAHTWGGTYLDDGYAVATDSSGNVYVTGCFMGTDVNFNPGGSDPHSSNGERDVFLSKFDSSGTFQWAHTWGGTNLERGRGVTVDSSDNVYVTGAFRSTTVNFNPGGSDIHSTNGYVDVFFSKFDSSGTFQWARTWGGTGEENSFGVATDSSGNVYVSGFFNGTDINFNPDGSDLHSSNGGKDVFLSKFDSSGTFQWARTWGGTGYDEGFGVATDSSGNVYVTGYFRGANVNFNPGGSDLHSSNGDVDAFFSKFDSSGTFQWARTWGGTSDDWAWRVAADSPGNVYVTGYFSGLNINFNPGGSDLHSSNGYSDVFLIKFLPDGYW